MVNRSHDRPDEQKTAKSSAAVDAVKTMHQAEAEADKRKVDARGHEADRPTSGEVLATNDSPKRHGDKMEHATRSAAGYTDDS